MKKFLMILIVLLLTACQKNDVLKFKDEYENAKSSIDITIDDKVKINYLSVTEVVDFLENKTGIIYFGFPTCPWCRNILPVLIDLAKSNNEVIYYFNPSELRGSNDESFNRIMTILDKYLQSDTNGKKVLYVPDVYFVKKGSIVGHHLGSAPSQDDPLIPLTDNQKEELVNIYKNLLGKIR